MSLLAPLLIETEGDEAQAAAEEEDDDDGDEEEADVEAEGTLVTLWLFLAIIVFLPDKRAVFSGACEVG